MMPNVLIEGRAAFGASFLECWVGPVREKRAPRLDDAKPQKK